jgi:hypothetical protein
VGPRADLDIEATGKILLPLPGIEPRSPGRPARSQDTILTKLRGLPLYDNSSYFITPTNRTKHSGVY